MSTWTVTCTDMVPVVTDGSELLLTLNDIVYTVVLFGPEEGDEVPADYTPHLVLSGGGFGPEQQELEDGDGWDSWSGEACATALAILLNLSYFPSVVSGAVATVTVADSATETGTGFEVAQIAGPPIFAFHHGANGGLS